MDYEALSTTLMFGACETQHCVNVTIVDDGLVEGDETFGITLNLITHLDNRLMLNTVTGMIMITDDDCKF